jgi:6-pyruvoyltetrahydropterin/6-carboxytetrahydropterin synthase
MATARLTRVVTFSASHQYYRPDWSAERNARVFGECAREHGHGHTYACRVTVHGRVDDTTGMVVDLRLLDQVLREEVVERFDHRDINHDVPEFAFGRQVPTGEALAAFIWERVARRLPDGVRLARVRVQEDPTLYADYDGPAENQ